MSRSYKSLELLQTLNPLVSLGIITGPEAKSWTDSYKRGDTKEIREFISLGKYPMKYDSFVEKIVDFLGND